MCFKKWFKKEIWPVNAKYQKRDFVRFKYKNEVHVGFVYEAYEKEGKIYYTIQMGGECPTFAYDYLEEKIIGFVPQQKF